MKTSDKIQQKCEKGGVTIPWLRTILSEVIHLENMLLEAREEMDGDLELHDSYMVDEIGDYFGIER